MPGTSLLETERGRRPGASVASAVRRIAADLIEQLGIDEPPVDVEMVASLLGIAEVIEDPLLPQSGCLVRVDGRLQVRVRQSDAPERKRFTIGHESGHTFFPGFERRPQYRCNPGSAGGRSRSTGVSGRRGRAPTPADPTALPDDVEQLCDVAASELLLPASLFTPDVRASTFGLDAVQDLAAAYEASLEATARRFVSVSNEDTALVILEVGQKPRERGTVAPDKLRVASTLTTGPWPYIPKHKSAAPDGPFDRALQGEVVNEMATISDIFHTPQHVEISAQLYPYRAGGDLVPRVLAMLRRF